MSIIKSSKKEGSRLRSVLNVTSGTERMEKKETTLIAHTREITPSLANIEVQIELVVAETEDKR